VTAVPRLITSKNLTFCLSLERSFHDFAAADGEETARRRNRKEEKKDKEKRARREKGREERRGSNGRKRRPSGTRSYLDEDHLRSLVIR